MEHGELKVTVYKNPELQRAALQQSDLLALEEGDGSLNDQFAQVPMSVFPRPALGKIVTINSDASILDAVKLLAEHRILSCPVVDVNAPLNATWVEKYMGLIDMSGIVMHMLETLKPENPEDFAAEAEKVEAFHQTKIKDAVSYAGFGTGRGEQLSFTTKSSSSHTPPT